MFIASSLILPRKLDTLQLPSNPNQVLPLKSNVATTPLPLVREPLQSQGLSAAASSVKLQAWLSGTQKQYSSYLRRWEQYCGEWQINPISATVVDGINFLSDLYQEELSYSAINTAWSALSMVIHITEGTFGNHPLVSRFLNWVFTARTSLPRYKNT